MEDRGLPARLVDVLRTFTFVALLVLALYGALAQAVRGERPVLLGRA
jgi:hypothetical protein